MHTVAEMNGDAELARWVGRTHTELDTPTLERVSAFRATLDDPRAYSSGDELPPGWHWILFHNSCPTAGLDADGHAPRGGFLPPVTLARRMWAGGSLRWHRPIRVDELIERRSQIASISTKMGRSGPLVFVSVQHRLFGRAGLAIEERQDIVYRDRPPRLETSSTQAVETESQAFPWVQTVCPDPVLLFRYSALTFNSHRIHYDRDYARQAEGYPGLLVHGPLIATLMLGLIRSRLPAAALRLFSYKAVSPLFDTGKFLVRGRPAADHRSAEIRAEAADGRLCMEAHAELAKD